MSGSQGVSAGEAGAEGRPLLSLRNVGKVWANGTVALSKVDLTIRQGEFLSLLGPSGCGKSTALRIVAGLTRPTSGEIAWNEGAMGGREIGFVFQEPTLMPWASVFDNVWLPLRLAGVTREAARARVTEALAGVGLSGFEQAVPSELSGGMKMRVSIARGLVVRPRLLLMDEPFAALDEITRFQLNDDLLRLWRDEGLTVVFVTHSVFESVYLSSRIAALAARPGRVFGHMDVDAPRRDAEFRTSPAYGELTRRASAMLGDAMEHSRGGAHLRESAA